MSYKIETTKRAEQDLAKIGKKNRAAAVQITEDILTLADNPRPPGVKKLTGQSPALYRLRSGDYRILYHIEEEAIVILVVKIGDRKEVYRYLKR